MKVEKEMEEYYRQEGRFLFRARVVNSDPMTNPEDGWVTGFYYQDLCGGWMKHFIRSGEMVWEVIPETVGKLLGFDRHDQPVFEGDILEMSPSNILTILEWDEREFEYVKHVYARDDVNNILMDGGRVRMSAGSRISASKKRGNIFDNKDLITRI